MIVSQSITASHDEILNEFVDKSVCRAVAAAGSAPCVLFNIEDAADRQIVLLAAASQVGAVLGYEGRVEVVCSHDGIAALCAFGHGHSGDADEHDLQMAELAFALGDIFRYVTPSHANVDVYLVDAPAQREQRWELPEGRTVTVYFGKRRFGAAGTSGAYN